MCYLELPVTDSSGKTADAIQVDAIQPAALEPPAAPEAPADHDDVALIHGRTDDGRGLKILRRRQDRIEVGAVVPLTPGKPIVGEVVRLEPRKESPLLCNVHVEYAPPVDARPTANGPAQVATDRYRQNWDLVFGGDRKSDPAMN